MILNVTEIILTNGRYPHQTGYGVDEEGRQLLDVVFHLTRKVVPMEKMVAHGLLTGETGNRDRIISGTSMAIAMVCGLLLFAMNLYFVLVSSQIGEKDKQGNSE